MEYEIDQFVAEQREAVEYDGKDRERHRDRDRRRDRDRDRDRDGRRRHRERRDRDRDSRRSYEGEYSSRSRDRQPYERDRGYDDDYGEDYTRYMGNYDSYGSSSQYDNQGHRDDVSESGYSGDSYSSGRYDRYGGRDNKAADKWTADPPTNTIILKGISSSIDEKDLRGHLMMTSTPVKEVRLVRDKVTGASRGFAFIEFQSVGDAQQWMEQNQGELHLLDQYRVSMYYSTPRRDSGPQPERMQEKHSVNPLMGVIGDWICSKCGVHNFKRREHCFKCNISRDESERGKESDGYDQVGHNPCNTLILRGLDALTTEESLTTAISKITLLPLKNLKVMRDEKTGVSKSFAFAEMNSIADSTELLETVNKLHGSFEVDGKMVMMNYAKNTFTTIMATQSAASQYYGQEYAQASGYYGEDGQYYDASYYDQYNYSQYYSQDSATPASTAGASGATQTDSTNAAAAVAQAAINKAQAAKALQKQQENVQKKLLEKLQQPDKNSKLSAEDKIRNQASQWAENQQSDTGNGESQEYPQYPEPDVSTYQYEESSGYYYDSITGLYYDANSQYYYNSTTGQFMYWDGEKKTYLPAPSDQQTPSAELPGADKDKDKKENKKDKVKVAKKIAKDMEKWAKTLNSQKEAQRDAFRKMFQPSNPLQKKEAATADAGFAIMEKSKRDEFVMPPPPAPGVVKKAEKPGLVASYGGDSDNEETEEDTQLVQSSNGQIDESKLTDSVKMACLLCKRQFPSQEALQRHQQLSDLHKKNLEELRKSQGNASSDEPELDSIAQTIQYRDRAKERREKYGAPAPPEPRKSGPKFSIPYEQPTKQGLKKDNKGNKLLQKMGWNEGQGLGKSGQGLVDPIQAARRTQGAGLGALGSRVNIEDSDSYKDACRKTMMARFQDMD